MSVLRPRVSAKTQPFIRGQCDRILTTMLFLCLFLPGRKHGEMKRYNNCNIVIRLTPFKEHSATLLCLCTTLFMTGPIRPSTSSIPGLKNGVILTVLEGGS